MGEPLPRRTRVLIFPVTGASGAAGPYCRLENEKAGTFRLRPFIMVRAGELNPTSIHSLPPEDSASTIPPRSQTVD